FQERGGHKVGRERILCDKGHEGAEHWEEGGLPIGHDERAAWYLSLLPNPISRFSTNICCLDWNLYLPLMAPDSVIFPLSVAGGDFKVPYMPLILSGIRIQGS